jgi:hypothetical protein
MFKKFSLISKILCYVEDKGIYLANMTITLKLVISCEALSLPIPFDGACFGHAISKATQYGTNDDKISKDLTLINLKLVNNLPILHHMTKKKKGCMLTILIFAMQT